MFLSRPNNSREEAGCGAGRNPVFPGLLGHFYPQPLLLISFKAHRAKTGFRRFIHVPFCNVETGFLLAYPRSSFAPISQRNPYLPLHRENPVSPPTNGVPRRNAIREGGVFRKGNRLPFPKLSNKVNCKLQYRWKSP